MNVAVIIPWRSTCEHRERALEWVRQRWREAHPDWTVHVSEDAGRGLWSKSKAVRRGVDSASTASVVVIADADVWAGPIADSVERVESGTAPWARPYNRVVRLDQIGTDRVLAGEAPQAVAAEKNRCAVRPYHHRAAGGLVVLRREDAVAVPIDPRFSGYGGEDFAWADALDTLVGRRVETNAVLYHLWHRPQSPKLTENVTLAARYRKALNRPAAMRTLLAEIRA